MKEILEEYGPVIVTVAVFALLIAIVMAVASGSSSPLQTGITNIIKDFTAKGTNIINGIGM